MRLRDVARVELGAQNYNQACTFDGQPSVGLGVLHAARAPTRSTWPTAFAQKMEELKTALSRGLDYEIAYDITPFIRESVADVVQTLLEAVVLVGVVVLVFLQNWRAMIIPLIAVPVAIIGTFAVMAALGFSLNNISLFGLVLAIGIVVDDAIVVVENVERWLEQGLTARGDAQGDGRSDRARHRRGPGAVRGVRALRLYQRHHRAVLPAVRRDDCRLDHLFGDQFADAQPGTGRDPAASRDSEVAVRFDRQLDACRAHWRIAATVGIWVSRVRFACSTAGCSAPARRPMRWIGGQAAARQRCWCCWSTAGLSG